MSGAIRVLLPPAFAHLASVIHQVGCTPVIDVTTGPVPDVPDGAWVRIRPGRSAPGTGPVILAELGAPVPDRPTWVETSAPRPVPKGYAGLILKGREASGLCGEHDGLEALAACPEPGRVILEAGLGPRGAGAAAALGAEGVLLTDAWLGCPEVNLPAGLERRLHLPDDEVTRVVGSLRIANPPTSAVLRRLAAGEEPWGLSADLWETGDLNASLWFAGQGLALARGLADRYGTLAGLLKAYAAHWTGWRELARRAVSIDEAVPVHTGDALAEPGTAASTGGIVGSGVLWEIAGWLGRPVHGGPTLAAAATGGPIVGSPERLADAVGKLPATGGTTSLRTPDPAAEPPVERSPAVKAAPAVAIIGIGCRFPGARDKDAFWANILNGVSSIGEVPPDRWDTDLYFDPDRDTPDKSYTKIGAFIEDLEFNSKAFRIPPKVAKQIDPVQQMTLTCVRDALDDANLKVDRRHDGRAFDRERCAVILGNSLGGEVSDAYAIRLHWHAVDSQLAGQARAAGLDADATTRLRDDLKSAYLADLPEINEDSMPGELANVIAGRIANAFDLGGANYTVDAACASSMAALQASVKTLQDGDADLVVTGGADRSMNITTYVKFCKIGALSPDHSAPFDDSANGFVMGEGCGILVLKRYEDAVADGDRIYSVIRGIGASSDGKGKGITAPNIKGQILALNRAYAAAGIDPFDVDLVECHGTSTVVGDKVEVEALTAVIGEGHRDARGPVRVGSVKSMIGHLKSAAGAAATIKASLAIHHGVFPPSLGFKKSRADVPLETVPLQVQTIAEPWPAPADTPRRCGVSAFGFGGTNFHVVLEGFTGGELPRSVQHSPPEPQPPADAIPSPVTAKASVAPPAAPVAATPVAATAAEDAPHLPDGIWATSGVDRAELLDNLKALAAGRPAPWNPSAPVRITAAARDEEERDGQLARAIKAIEKGTNPDMLRARAIHLEEQPFDGRIALLFTGQGSQYLDMGLDLAAAYPMVARTFAEADEILAPTLGSPITDFIRLVEGQDADVRSNLLRQTEYSQPATLTLDIAILRLLAAYGVSPDVVAGHSLGEYGAAVASGVMTFEQALYAVSARGREMANIRLDDPGKMAGIAASTDVVESVLAEIDGYVIAANKNCPTQTVIAGASDAVDEASERFKARGMTVYPLPVSHAFHSQIVEPASEPLRAVLGRLGLKAPRRPITTNVTGEYYPSGEEAVPKIIDLLAQQISSPVEWVAQMERMYGDGARVFVEVGPKRALSGFTVSILKRRPHRALYTNHPKRGGVASFRDALAGLLAYGFPIQAEPSEVANLFAPAPERLATTEAIAAFARGVRPDEAHAEALPDIREGVLRIVAEQTGYEIDELDLDYELEADLGIDTVKQAEVFSVVRSTWNIAEDVDFDFSANRTLGAIIGWVAERTGGSRIAVAPVVMPAPTPAPSPGPPVPAGLLLDEGLISRFLTDAARAGLDDLDAEGFARAMLPAVQGLLGAAFVAAQQARPAPKPAPAPPAPAPAPVSAPRAATESQRASSVLPGSIRGAEPQIRVACTGASLGLPGGEEVFGASNLVDMLSGQNRIAHIGADASKFLEKGLVRLVKDSKSGQGSFLPVEDESQVIRLAGVKRAFDVTEWGIPEPLARAFDVTTQLAFAAGLEALRDAGIPLVRVYKTTATGKRVPQGWQLPEPLRDGTGVVFGSAFPGFDRLIEKIGSGGDDGEGRFDRRFLFQILPMAHAQFAQFIGARGPNTGVNAACASTTQALAIAHDWIRVGRCERVIVVGADDVTNGNLLPWIGSGFMAAGAATTLDKVEEAALPFDRRRHGMILGMGAVGMVMERVDEAEARGVAPVAELAGSLIVNSAFHGTRLDIDHIQASVGRLVEQVSEAAGTTADAMARSAFFVSHETYTPARGGSSAAEVAALRNAFGDASTEIVIANTKGYTGHPMGAGIEDAVAVKGLQYGIVPPIANLRHPDPELGPLNLSRGVRRDLDWCVRLAAGFGSQLAVAIWRRSAVGDERVLDPAAREAWLKQITGFEFVKEQIDQRTLRVSPARTKNTLLPLVPEISPADGVDFVRSPWDEERPIEAPAPVAAPAPEAQVETPAPETAAKVIPLPGPGAAVSVDYNSVLAELTAVVAQKTGYEIDELESDYELEADLGIDTVKQAEILSDLTDRYGLQPDEDFKMADYPTIESLAKYLSGVVGNPGESAPVAEVASPEPVVAPEAPKVAPEVSAEAPKVAPEVSAEAPSVGPVVGDVGDVDTLPDLIAVVADKTGYEPDELEPDFELEADLGVDTVKQAEIISALQERYQLPPDDDFSLADHPTLGALATYLDGRRALAASGDIAPAEVAGSADASAASAASEGAPGIDAGRPDWTDEQFNRMQVGESVVEDHPVPLPASFRIRRPVEVVQPQTATERLEGRHVRVLGEGEIPDAIRAEVAERGGHTEGPYDVVIDAADDVALSFAEAQAMDSDRPAWWLTLTRLGGFATSFPLERGFVDGARAGFTKSLGREWEDTQARVVDVAPTASAVEVAAMVCGEVGAGAATEVFLGEGGRRAIAYRVEDRPAHGALDGSPVVLITGGARGICAQIAHAMAQRGEVSLALVGRGPAGTEPLDEAAEKARIKAELTDAGERATPARVSQQLAPLQKAEEIRVNLAALRDLGRTVQYFRCDTSDPQAVARLVQEVTEALGAIDVCIHGAGVEESRQLADKNTEAWHRVFDGKAEGGRALISGLSPQCVFVSMGSVAGRFGNPGQVDYAAANDALARLCLSRPRSLHVDWTAWDDVGMAARGGMKHLLTERGVELLPADAGAGLLVDLVASGTTGEIVVAGALGDFLPAPSHPLIDRLELDGDTFRAHRDLTLQSDPWLADHSIEGVPVLPGVIGLEMMIAVAGVAAPGQVCAGARDVHFDAPVKVHGDRVTQLIIEARAIKGTDEVAARLISERALRTGRVSRTEHFSARLVFGAMAVPESLPSAFLPDEPITAEAIYRRFFHGPRFQVLTEVFGVSADGLVAEARVAPSGIAQGLVSAPLVLESAFQAAGLHQMIVAHEMGLPMHVQEVTLLDAHDRDRTFSLTVRQTGEHYDIDVDAGDGPVMRVRGFSMVTRGPLPDGDRWPVPEGGRPECFPLSEAGATEKGRTEARASAEEDVAAWLTSEELAVLRSRGTARRIADRIAGRIAAKRALVRLTGVAPLDIRVERAASGAPIARVPGHPGVSVSISHREGRGVAVAVAAGRVGVDLEQVEPRSAAFAQTWYHPEERALAQEDPTRITALWSIKEAVLKVLGTGMALSPKEVHVVALEDGRATVALHGAAAERLEALGGGEIVVRWAIEAGGRLLAEARMAA